MALRDESKPVEGPQAELAESGKPDRRKALLEYSEREVWPPIPASERGGTPTRAEEDEILGYGPDGF